MKVSIITTIYKAEKDLPRLLDSMMALKSPELEFFLIDNGSPDRCGQICSEYLKKDSRFVLRSLKTNIGYVQARNLGLREVDADYVGFCDSDDYLEPNGYDVAIKTLKDTNCDFYIASYNERLDTEKQKRLPPFPKGLYSKRNNNLNDILSQFYGSMPNRPKLIGFVWKNLYKQSILKDKNILFLEYLKPYEDELFNLDIANSCDSIFVDDTVIYNYVHNPESLTKKMLEKFCVKEEWDRIEALYTETKMRSPHDMEIAINNATIDLFYALVLWAVKTNKGSLRNCVKEFKTSVNQSMINEVCNNYSRSFNKRQLFLTTCLRRRWFLLLFYTISKMLYGRN